MKTDNKYTAIAFIATMLLFALSAYLQAAEKNEVWIGAVLPNMSSEHIDQCNPVCLRQQNGGSGFMIGFRSLDKGSLDVAIGRFCFTNSYSDPGCVDILQLTAARYEYKFLELGLLLWKMRITGYKREIKDKSCIEDDADGGYCKYYEDKVVDIPLWPIPKIGINPLYAFTDHFNVDFYFFFTPAVRINITAITYGVMF